MKQAALLAIRLYQLVLSPLFGGQCRYHPCCSAYTREAIDKYGLLKGLSLGCRRLFRCHPFHQGGVDQVP